MNRLCAICDSPEDARYIRRRLEGVFATECVPSDRILEAQPRAQFSIVSVDLNDTARIQDLRRWLKTRPKRAKLIFVTQKGSRLQAAQACALGATDIVYGVADAISILAAPCRDLKSLADGPSEFKAEASPGIDAALEALQEVFAAAVLGTAPDPTAIDKAGEAIVQQIRTDGLDSWIETVRKHHSQTYQHSLLVTGVAVGFGRQLGVSQRDQKRLSFASIFHDIGKARIPVAILEKPGPLDEDEMAVMKQHPSFGSEALGAMPGLPAEMIDVVLHHHEYLDGSGYPHGLSGNEIPDLVRILTIADIFGALIERRSYKPPLAGQAAYQILLDMGAKLDRDLVREFRAIARLPAPLA